MYENVTWRIYHKYYNALSGAGRGGARSRKETPGPVAGDTALTFGVRGWKMKPDTEYRLGLRVQGERSFSLSRH